MDRTTNKSFEIQNIQIQFSELPRLLSRTYDQGEIRVIEEVILLL